MGGAERSARKRKQAAQAVAAARGTSKGGGDRTKIIAGIAVVAVLAVAVIGYVVYEQMKPSTPDVIPLAAADHVISAPAVREGANVVVGKDTATVTVDVYEDFLCPICGDFEKIYGQTIKQAVDDGKVKIRYHILPMLNSKSDPPGYSTDSANAGLCAADAGQFNAFHAALFATQPEEGDAGYTKDQLIKLGKDAGITAATFDSCVRNDTYKSELDGLMAKTRDEPVLKDPETNQFRGTPSVVANGKMVDLDNRNWLSDLTK